MTYLRHYANPTDEALTDRVFLSLGGLALLARWLCLVWASLRGQPPDAEGRRGLVQLNKL